jgi:hypothetical protein
MTICEPRAWRSLRSWYMRAVHLRTKAQRRPMITAAINLLHAINQTPTLERISALLEQAFGFVFPADEVARMAVLDFSDRNGIGFIDRQTESTI